ncbi:MAG: sensor histidine kinase [Candidatus Thorarchaeota archaeon]
MSGEPKEQAIIGHVAWRVILAVIVVLGLFIIFNPIWVLSPVRVGLHTLLAFLAFIAAAVVCYELRKQSIVWKYLLLSVFMFVAIVNFVAAIWHLNPLYSIADIVEVTADLVEMILLGLLILTAIIPTKFTNKKVQFHVGISLVFTLTLSALLIYGVIYYILLPLILSINQLFTGITLGVINISIIVVPFLILIRTPSILHRWDKITFITGLVLMLISTFFLILSFVQPIILLPVSVMIRAAMVYSLFMAVALPLQEEIGISRERAYLQASGMAILTVVPYFLTVIIVTIIPFSLVFVEQGIYSLSHFTVAVLAAIIVRLLWLFTKQQPQWHRYALVLVFVTVIILESTIFLLSPWVEITGEYTLLYVLAGVMIVGWLILTVKWVFHPPTKRDHSKMVWWIAGYSAVMLAVILAGVLLQTSLQTIFFWIDVQVIIRGILLGVCFISIFLLAFLFIIFLLVSKSKLTLGIIVLGSVTLWVIANMVRVNFMDWTAGWWIAQFLLLFGFMMGPATLGRLYLTTLENSEQERKRATLYADILVHDLRNYHTAIQSSLDLLMLAQDTTEVVDEVNDQMQIALDRADRLITNVRSLELAKSLQLKDLVKTDVVALIEEAWKHIEGIEETTVQFQVNRKPDECYVLANELLLEVFINLFRNALQHSKEIERVQVDINPLEQNNVQCWEVRVSDWGQGISPEDKERLFTRYIEGAKGFGLGLSVVKSLTEAFGGSVSVENRISDDYTQGTIFILTLVRS